MAILLVSLALGRADKALVTFSSITRMLMVHILGTERATVETTGMVQALDDLSLIVYAMTYNSIETVGGT
jgi:hypothetical protein